MEFIEEKEPVELSSFVEFYYGECFKYENDSDIFMKCQSHVDANPVRVNLRTGQVFGYPPKENLQVVKVNVVGHWKAARS